MTRASIPDRYNLQYASLLALFASACSVELVPTTAAVTEETAEIPSVTLPQQRPLPEPYDDLRPDEQAIVDLFENTSPSVVYISTVTRRRDLFGRSATVPQGTGTGFVWDDDGHIVTNFHVLQGAASARVVMHDQTNYVADYVGGSPRHDLAVLRVDAQAQSLREVQLGDSDRVRVGQSVYAIGNPFGLSATLTTGIVSALNRQIEGLTSDIIEDVIQIDAAINPGNSGGPLLDSQGRLIGINSQIASPSGVSAGVGFAVPVNTVMRVVPQLIATGEYTPARLGITTDQRLNRIVANRLGVTGVLIDQVDPQSGAASAGLRSTEPNANQLGDIILRIDGDPVPTFRDLRLVLDRYEPGDEVEVTISRDGDTQEVTVPLM
ncbi:MAG: trypsin-like peptidase domain-containing protein [Acidobacteriota bacterium]|nr:trypsin-like peptidase domain-containing protein [Acidobacteriota bacterium]